MPCLVRDVVSWLDARFPPSWAESWDLVGLQVGDPQASVGGVVVALDPTLAAVREAQKRGAALLVTHHPLWLQPLAAVRRNDPTGRVVWEAVRGGISIFCVHTNLDRAPGGPNDLLAERLELQSVGILAEGLGRIGDLARPMSAAKLSVHLQDRFPHSALRWAGPSIAKVRKVAVCCGSGGGMLEEAHRFGAQVLVTGDGKYHDARKAEALGLALLDVGHFASEQILIPWLVRQMEEASASLEWNVEARAFSGERDPFRTLNTRGPAHRSQGR